MYYFKLLSSSTYLNIRLTNVFKKTVIASKEVLKSSQIVKNENIKMIFMYITADCY